MCGTVRFDLARIVCAELHLQYDLGLVIVWLIIMIMCRLCGANSCKKRSRSHHCEGIVDPMATWVQSWHALERAFAEGRASSIGVSNFDVTLLEEFKLFANVFPHAVQNFEEPGSK